MVRTALSAIAGAVAWIVVVTILNFGLRLGLPGYQAAEPTMVFSVPMMAARLIESTMALVVAGSRPRGCRKARRRRRGSWP